MLSLQSTGLPLDVDCDHAPDGETYSIYKVGVDIRVAGGLEYNTHTKQG